MSPLMRPWARGITAMLYLVLLTSCFQMCLAESNEPYPKISAQTYAQTYTSQLRMASLASDSQVSSVVRAILDELQIPILSHPSNNESAAGGVYPWEIDAVAKAFRKGVLTELDDIAAILDREGLRFGGPSFGTGSSLAHPSGALIESALRQLRKQVEEDESRPNALFILLVDELGKRDDRPFDLLREPDKDCISKANRLPVAQTYSSMAASEATAVIDDALAEARADGDTETVELLSKLQAGALNSDWSKALKPFLDDAAKMAGMAVATQVPGLSQMPSLPQLPSSGVQSLDALNAVVLQMSQNQLSGKSLPADVSGEKALELFRLERDSYKESKEKVIRETEEATTRLRETSKEMGAEEAFGSIGLKSLGAWAVGDALQSSYDLADVQYRELENQQEELKDEQEVVKDWKMGFPIPEAASCIYLDAVQLLLVQVDLFGLYREGAFEMIGGGEK